MGILQFHGYPYRFHFFAVFSLISKAGCPRANIYSKGFCGIVLCLLGISVPLKWDELNN